MNLAQIGNLVEAIVWLAIGAMLGARSLRAAKHGRLLRVLAATFVVFGLTDLVEIQSGAWWRPTWLLAIKAVCVISFAVCLACYLRSKSQMIDGDAPPS